MARPFLFALARRLRTAHAVAAVVAQVAVAIADGDCPAVIAARGVELELGELVVAAGGLAAGINFHRHSSPLQHVGIEPLGGGAMAVAVAVGMGTVRAIRSLANASGWCRSSSRRRSLTHRLPASLLGDGRPL